VKGKFFLLYDGKKEHLDSNTTRKAFSLRAHKKSSNDISSAGASSSSL
jgi:hypothetical protein